MRSMIQDEFARSQQGAHQPFDAFFRSGGALEIFETHLAFPRRRQPADRPEVNLFHLLGGVGELLGDSAARPFGELIFW